MDPFPDTGACKRSGPWSKPLISPGCARPECRKNDVVGGVAFSSRFLQLQSVEAELSGRRTSYRSSRCGLVSPPARPHGDFLSALSSDAGKGNEDPKASFDRTTDGAGDL